MAVSTRMQQRAMLLLDAFNARRRGQDSVDYWAGRFPSDEAEQKELAEAFDRHGVDLFNRGAVQAALDAFWPNFLIRIEIVKRHPSDRAAIRDFASAEDLIGLACITLKKFKTAEDMLSEALTYRHGLFEDDPSDAHAAMLYGVALGHMGQLEQARGNPAKARDYLSDARDHLAQVDRIWSGISFIEIELAEATERLEALS